MVSFHTPLSPTRRKIIPDLENMFKKRKLNDDDQPDQAHKILDHHQNPVKGQSMIKSTPDTELHLETPIPLEWQRCLDIKSGQIYFYNTRTNKRMLSDPRSSPEPPPPAPPSHCHMSLDLELNLPCGSSYKNQVTDIFTKNNNSGSSSNSLGDHQLLINSSATKNNNNNNNKNGGLTRSPSWLTFEGEQEMVAAACKKCHMLVMMCKSSPSCPNCKFMHPPEQSTPNLLKRRLSLLC